MIVLDPLTNVEKRHFKSEDTLHTGKVIHCEQTTGTRTNRDWWHKKFETESLSLRRRQPLDQRHRIDIDPRNFLLSYQTDVVKKHIARGTTEPGVESLT